MPTKTPQLYQIKTMALKDLKDNPANPREITPAALDGLESSLKEFGLVQPIIWNRRSGFIVGGHQRKRALERMGHTQAQVLVVDFDPEKEMLANLTLNNPAIQGTFTEAAMPLLDGYADSNLNAYQSLMLDDLRFDLFGDRVMEGKTDPNEAPPLPRKTKIKPGDRFKLGDHRLLCADATDMPSISRLLDGKLADLVCTDPPYGIDYGKKNRFLNSFQKAGRNLKDIANDMIGKDELFDMLVKAFTNAYEAGADHCSYYVTAPQGGELGLMMMMMMASNLPTRHVLIWNKNSQNFSLGRLDYEYKHEPILYTWKKTHKFYGKGPFTNSVWDIPKEKKCDVHPTMKPVALIQNAILNSTKKGDVVMDMFLGSGTTLIAAETTERQGMGIELDPLYCDVIIQRWQEFTGKKAVKVS